MERPPQLGDLLVSVGIISKQQLVQALDHQKQYGGRLGEVLVKLGACTEDDIRGALDAQEKRTPLAQRLAVIKGRQVGAETQTATAMEVAWRSTQLFEREMRRISKDVKDISQLLAEMSLQVEAARKTAVASPETGGQVLGQLWEQLSVVVRELGFYAIELAPAALEDANLLVVLRQYAAHYRTCYDGTLEIGLRSDDVRMSHQTAIGLFRAIQCVVRGVGNSEGNRDVRLFLAVEEDQATAILEFERVVSTSGALGDPVGEMEDRVGILGGSIERQEDGDAIRITCRAPVGQLPPGPKAGGIVVS